MKPTSDSELIQLRSAICDTSIALSEAAVQALLEPLDYPSVDLAFVPGDRLVIALHDNLPNPFGILTPILDWLIRQLEPKNVSITVVISENHHAFPKQLAKWLADHHPSKSLVSQEELRQRETVGSDTDPANSDGGSSAGDSSDEIRVVVYSPDEPQSLEYIAASDNAEPMYLQRELVEADFVIPIYRWLEPSDPRGPDPYVVLPAFADGPTKLQYAKQWLMQSPASSTRSWSQQTGWLLGVQFTVGVVLNHDGQVGMLAAGNPESVAQACSQAVVSKHTSAAVQALDLVVVRIILPDLSEGSRGTRWDEVASAAWIAEKWLSPTGRIVVVADKLMVATEGISSLASDEPDAELIQELLSGPIEDAFPAALLRSVQSRRSIYLQCQVDPETLESLGFASIANAAQLERLINGAGRVGVLEY